MFYLIISNTIKHLTHLKNWFYVTKHLKGRSKAFALCHSSAARQERQKPAGAAPLAQAAGNISLLFTTWLPKGPAPNIPPFWGHEPAHFVAPVQHPG